MGKSKQIIISLSFIIIMVLHAANIGPVYATNVAQKDTTTMFDQSSKNDVDMGLFLREYETFLEEVYSAYEKSGSTEWRQNLDTAYISMADLYVLLKTGKDYCYCDLGFGSKTRNYSVIYNSEKVSYSVTYQISDAYSSIAVYEFSEDKLVRKYSLTLASRNGDTVILYTDYDADSSIPSTYRSINCSGGNQENICFSIQTIGEVDEIVFDIQAWINGKDYSWSRELLYESEAAETDDDEQNDADIEAAADFEASVDALPDPHAVTLDDELEIRAVREAYAELSDGAKALVDQAALQKLEDCEAALQRIKDAIDHDPVPSGEGGGFTPSYPTYQATITKTEHGEVTVNPETPEFGDKVTVTVKPDDGYELDELTVTDQLGCKITLTDHSDGTFSFKQPAQKVTITATFKVKAPVNCFDDISEDMYCYDAVLWAYYAEPKITNGMDDTHFGPDETSTRAHIVTFLWRAKGEPEPTETHNPFEDIKETDYFYEAVLWAVEQGIVKGTDETHFTPKQTCSTAHIITMLYRALGAGTDGWYEEAGAWAEKLGLLADTGLTVDKNVDCPRGAIVTFLYRALAKE